MHRLLIEWLDSARPDHKPSVVCLGFFDGVHLGHQAILHAAKAVSEQESLVFCVHTYDAMPSRVLTPDREVAELTPYEEKAALLKEMGVQLLAVSKFDEALMRLSGQAFLFMLKERLNATHIVAGYDHRFGCHGDTDADKLVALCREMGMGVTVVDAVRTPQGAAISSTAIRNALANGDIPLVEQMLGRPVSPRMRSLFVPEENNPISNRLEGLV